MTDDQGVDTMRAMPKTRRLIGRAGVRFRRAFASYPLCCPSRATFLTGQYAHNHGVLDNHPPAGGYGALDPSHSLAVWLNRVGYRTGFVGKYLNGYGKAKYGGPEVVPRGWSSWTSVVPPTREKAYDYQLNRDGRLVHHGDRPADYKTDVLSDAAARFVRQSGRRPFFLWVATPAPHTDPSLPTSATRNPIPAPRDWGSFADARFARGPSYNERNVSDKPRFIRRLPRLSQVQRRNIRKTFVSQLETLGAVDDLVARLMRRLRAEHLLSRTLFVFTSDNGYLRGEHRLDSGKAKVYEPAIRVPLIGRGPGLPRGVADSSVVTNVSLAPTILDLPGADSDVVLDGRSLDSAIGNDDGSAGALIEILERPKGQLEALRTPRYLYAEHLNRRREVELYDLRRDPHELRNLAGARSARPLQNRLADRLDELRSCAGPECW